MMHYPGKLYKLIKVFRLGKVLKALDILARHAVTKRNVVRCRVAWCGVVPASAVV